MNRETNKYHRDLRHSPKKTNEEMYLDWVNNFLTVERFAEYYSMTVVQATSLIESEKERNRNEQE
jgi:hypothetical protein